MNSLSIKPIETLYKGYRFRSRLEARWAVFFDEALIKWEYEVEGYDLNGIWYLPDFWLPEKRWFAEIKQSTFTEKEEEKCKLLSQGTKFPCLMLDGIPDMQRNYSFFVRGHLMEFRSVLFRALNDRWKQLDPFNEKEFLLEFYRTERAAISAKQARFEHGTIG